MGRLDRFLRLERPRPDRKDGGSAASLDRFRDPPPAPPDEDVTGERVPRSCAKCGAENNAAAPRCFNCGADLDSPEMHAHQRGERRRAREENEQRRREAEELAERELAKLRQEAAARRETLLPPPVPGTIHEAPFQSAGGSPLVWLLRGLSVIEDPWYRFGARVLVIGAFLGLVFYALSSPARYPLFILAAILLGGAFGGRRWNRWDRWDRWGRWR